MDQNLFIPSNFFDLSEFPFKDIFDGVNNVWEVLSKIQDYTGGKLMQGKDCFVHPNTSIRDGVILGDNVHIGFAVELKNCIILNNTRVPHLSYVGDAVVGNNCNVSVGAKFANFRLDHQPIVVKKDGQRYETGLVKFGGIVGDGSWVGVNSVINPGTILGKNCKVYPLVSVIGCYPNDSIITSTK